jgi:RNA polymerase sigma-70 factor, ECF subfamily
MTESPKTHADPPSPPGDVTRLLIEWNAGDAAALERLIPLVYGELRLQPTALVHEVYLRLVDQTRVKWQNRAHFFGVAARAMREILVDHARKRRAAKRGGSETLISIEDVNPATPSRNIDLLDLDRTLVRLAALDERQARLVELRVFGGLTIDEAAEVMSISPATVSREWRHAETWLHREMS